MIVRSLPTGVLAVSHPAHALLAFQLADHWGNRATPRPGPRADVLAAVLLGAGGPDDLDQPPRLGPDGAPLAFEAWPSGEREALWRRSIVRADACGRYVGWLVSSHVASLAGGDPGAHRAFLAKHEQRRAGLAVDPRHRQLLATGGDAVNRAILRISDAVASHLILGLAAPATVPDLPRRTGAVPLVLEPLRGHRVRLQPWPFSGPRLTVAVEARQLPAARFADQPTLAEAWRVAPRRRLSWTLECADSTQR
jgi:hypothetical protein